MTETEDDDLAEFEHRQHMAKMLDLQRPLRENPNLDSMTKNRLLAEIREAQSSWEGFLVNYYNRRDARLQENG